MEKSTKDARLPAQEGRNWADDPACIEREREREREEEEEGKSPRPFFSDAALFVRSSKRVSSLPPPPSFLPASLVYSPSVSLSPRSWFRRDERRRRRRRKRRYPRTMIPATTVFPRIRRRFSAGDSNEIV